MISKIYTFRDKKKVWVEVPALVRLKSKKQMEKLVDCLLDIDAVETPAEDFQFPCVVKILDNTFGPRISQAKSFNEKDISKISEIKKAVKAAGLPDDSLDL